MGTETTVTFNPQGLLVTVAFLAALGLMLTLAINPMVSAAIGAVSSVLVDIFLAINPRFLHRER